MKRAFQILKDRPVIDFTLTRDSVCAADDCDAPHLKQARIHSFSDPVDLARESSKEYLPQNIYGTGHSWICLLNDRQIAEVHTGGVRPLVREVELKETNAIHFTYSSSRP